MPTSVGYQDLAALIARQPAVTERWREHVRNSTFGTIHAAIFSFPRPIGSSIPDPYFTQLAALDPRALDVTGSVPLPAPIELQFAAPVYDFPVVERRLKGDRLIVKKVPQLPAAPAYQPAGKPPKLKDQASLIPGPKPAARPADPEPSVEAQPAPLAQKGDRAPVKAEMPVATATDDGALARAADAAEQIGNGSRAAESVPPKTVVIVEKPAPVERQQTPPAATRKAEKPKPVATRSQDAALQRAGSSAESAAQSMDTAQAAASAPKSPAVIAENTAPEAPAAPAPVTEIADLESQRADVHGPLQFPPVPVAEAPVGESAPQSAMPAVAQNEAVEPPLTEKQVDRFEVVEFAGTIFRARPADHAPLFRNP